MEVNGDPEAHLLPSQQIPYGSETPFLLKLKLGMSKERTHNLNYFQEARDIPETFLTDMIFCSITTFFTNV